MQVIVRLCVAVVLFALMLYRVIVDKQHDFLSYFILVLLAFTIATSIYIFIKGRNQK